MSQSAATLRATFGPLRNPIRGLLHGGAALVAIAIAAQFLSIGGLPPGLHAALVAFAATQAALFLTSASHHSLPWSARWKRLMQRADHAMIFLAIAGSVTPLAWLGLSAPLRMPTILAVWTIAALGVAQKGRAYTSAPRSPSRSPRPPSPHPRCSASHRASPVRRAGWPGSAPRSTRSARWYS